MKFFAHLKVKIVGFGRELLDIGQGQSRPSSTRFMGSILAICYVNVNVNILACAELSQQVATEGSAQNGILFCKSLGMAGIGEG